MKTRIFTVILFAALVLTILAGCADGNVLARVEKLERSVEQQLDRVEERVENTVRDAVVPPVPERTQSPQEVLEQSEAERIALEHAGFAAKDIKNLRTEYEIDDGVPEYHVEFRQDRWEYDYEIHAETGKILSFEKDD